MENAQCRSQIVLQAPENCFQME